MRKPAGRECGKASETRGLSKKKLGFHCGSLPLLQPSGRRLRRPRIRAPPTEVGRHGSGDAEIIASGIRRKHLTAEGAGAAADGWKVSVTRLIGEKKYIMFCVEDVFIEK